MTIEKLANEFRKKKARCMDYCGTWNREDHDCEIFGEYHPSPSHCKYFLMSELARRNEEDRK